jgi:hypothetical protein
MKTLLLTLLIVLISCSTVSVFGSDTDEMSEFLVNSIHKQLMSDVSPASIDHSSPKSPTCNACHIAMQGMQKLPHKQVLKMLVFIGTEYCVLKKLQDKAVCKGAIGEMINYIVTSLWAHYFDPHLACHKIKVQFV